MSGSPTRPTRRRSFASLGGYSAIAQRWGLRLCDCGSLPCGPGHHGNHEAGWTAYRMKVIHWRDRPVTRRGLYRFHKLLAKALYREASIGVTRAEALYWQNVHGAQLALTGFGLRFPRAFSDHDRSRARLWLSKLRPGIDDEFPEQREITRRIREWSRP